MTDFTLQSEQLDLPAGAFAKTERRWLTWRGRKVLAFVQGPYRPYAFPLLTPAGYLVSSESPADHPHHNSLWLGADHVHCLHPVGDGKFEQYTYNFYVNETFQGRAAGRQIETTLQHEAVAGERYRVNQQIEWRGPPEWGAPDGRAALSEQRSWLISAEDAYYRFDIASALTALDDDVQLGPTRHAYFNVRVAETMTETNGGSVRDNRGHVGAAAVSGEGASWVDFCGPVGGAARAGLTVIARPQLGAEASWFVADWGVVTTGFFRTQAIRLERQKTLRMHYTVLAHDGELARALLDEIAAERD